MVTGLAGCGGDDNTPPVSIISFPKYTSNTRTYTVAREGTLHVKLLNRSGTETLVLRGDVAGEAIVIPPGEYFYIKDCKKGESFRLKADGYSGSIKVKVPEE